MQGPCHFSKFLGTMKNKLGAPGAAIGTAVFCVFLGGLSLAVYAGWDTMGKWLERDSAAAWVQAIGSVIAIIAAASIAVYQVAHARRLEQDRRRASEIQRLSVVTSLMARSYVLAKDVVTAFREPSDYHFSVIDSPLMRDTVETMRAIPLFEIPSGMAAIDVRSAARYLSRLADHWDKLKNAVSESGNPPSQDDIAELVSFCEELMTVTGDALNDCKAGIRTRGGTWS